MQAGGFPLELAGDIPLGADRKTVHDALSQPSSRWRRRSCLRSHPIDGAVSDGRLRQDHARPPDGRGLDGRPASTCPPGRCCAATAARGDRRSAPARISGRTGRMCAPARRRWRSGRRSSAGIARSYGHCMTMGTASTMTGRRRRAGHVPAGRLLDPRRRRRAYPNERGLRAPDRRDGVGGSETRRHPHPRQFRERDPRRHGDGLLDQRDHSCDRDGPARRPRCGARRLSKRASRETCR